MKKFPYEQFLEDNRVDTQQLPEMLQKRISGFEELKEDWSHTLGEDHRIMENRLDFLSQELEEDLEEHFEKELENNDLEEEEQPEVEPQPEPEPEPQEIIDESPPVMEPEKLTEEPNPEPETVPEPEPVSIKEPSDEEILESFIADKKHKVFPIELKEKGFKTRLGQKRLLVGKFCLHRGKYDTCYKIIISG